ncbi:hypothetical protein A2U01_0049928 [Trifolium medium]|uniref:Uncharacterized protein n=1 Tax=Trifolium medium TaxID=97028 RepID=A0A392QYX6_9FABA|nr:hypothetical protein [Trifolium medium]
MLRAAQTTPARRASHRRPDRNRTTSLRAAPTTLRVVQVTGMNRHDCPKLARRAVGLGIGSVSVQNT